MGTLFINYCSSVTLAPEIRGFESYLLYLFIIFSSWFLKNTKVGCCQETELASQILDGFGSTKSQLVKVMKK
jgi:hypothetical protein